MIIEHTMDVRVRYPECDPMGYLHHSIFLQYMEMARIDLLRTMGLSYAEMEKQDILFVVVKVEVRYKSPAHFDDQLKVTVRLMKQTYVRLDHTYEIKRGDTMIAEASTTIACVGRDGQLMAIPEALQNKVVLP